jgi:hypothetical protein
MSSLIKMTFSRIAKAIPPLVAIIYKSSLLALQATVLLLLLTLSRTFLPMLKATADNSRKLPLDSKAVVLEADMGLSPNRILLTQAAAKLEFQP